MINCEAHPLRKLAKRYPQICLPVQEGVKDSLLYRSVVLRGKEIDPEPLGFSLSAQDTLQIYHTPAGNAEVLYLSERADFERAVCALAYRCEPKRIPPSMGATTIIGLINWEKIREHRIAYETGGCTDWNDEFHRFTAKPENYRDTLILVSRGYFSAVMPDTVGQTESEWLEQSLRIRTFHELTHFVCRKMFPKDVDAVRDEVLADAIGIVAAFGFYRSAMARLFLGIEAKTYRNGGRLENYKSEEENMQSVMDRANFWIEQAETRSEFVCLRNLLRRWKE